MIEIRKLNLVIKNKIYKFIYNNGTWYVQRFLYKDDDDRYWFYVILSNKSYSVNNKMNCRRKHDCMRKMYELTRNEVIMEML